MAISSQELSSLTAGITRLREKGGASPSSLYDLLNAYIDQSGSPTGRDGTIVEAVLPTGTTGMCAFQGKLHVFALSAIDVGSAYVCDILIHPDPAFAGTIKKIHYAKPFLGFLYVVAEFSDGSIYHYWQRSSGVWLANHIYLPGDSVSPTTPNGYQYTASVSNSPTSWSPGVVRNLGDTVQPTTANGWYYVVTEVDGASPASGTTEPTWPVQDGAQVIEDVDTSTLPSNTDTTTSTGSPAGPRYNNLPGGNTRL